MNNRDRASAFDGRARPHAKADGTRTLPSGVLPQDFIQRLERLKEASGLSWRGLARALDVDPKQLARWRKGVEPCGGAMHSIFRFAARMPGGLEILLGGEFQVNSLDGEEQLDEDAAEDREVAGEEKQDQDQQEKEEEDS